jgi:hypothetical protein
MAVETAKAVDICRVRDLRRSGSSESFKGGAIAGFGTAVTAKI